MNIRAGCRIITTIDLGDKHDQEPEIQTRLEKGDVRFFNLSGKGKVEQGDSPEELGDILLLDESVLQSQRYLDQESGHDR